MHGLFPLYRDNEKKKTEQKKTKKLLLSRTGRCQSVANPAALCVLKVATICALGVIETTE